MEYDLVRNIYLFDHVDAKRLDEFIRKNIIIRIALHFLS